jgi:hypothetical protein
MLRQENHVTRNTNPFAQSKTALSLSLSGLWWAFHVGPVQFCLPWYDYLFYRRAVSPFRRFNFFFAVQNTAQ